MALLSFNLYRICAGHVGHIASARRVRGYNLEKHPIKSENPVMESFRLHILCRCFFHTRDLENVSTDVNISINLVGLGY